MARFQCYRTEDSRIRWRLLGGNNRIICLGIQWHADLVGAMAEVALVRLVAPASQVRIEHNEAGLWWWHLAIDKANLARSAQGFPRRIDAERAVERFRRSADEARIDPGLAIFPAGKRGRLLRPAAIRHSPKRNSPAGFDVSRQHPVP